MLSPYRTTSGARQSLLRALAAWQVSFLPVIHVCLKGLLA